MPKKKTGPRRDAHLGCTVHVRAESLDAKGRWRAAADARGWSLSQWMAHIANENSLPLRKDRQKA